MSSDTYEDLGYHGKPTAWDAVQEVECPRCRAAPGAHCVNPVCGRPARLPCLARARAASVQADKADHFRER